MSGLLPAGAKDRTITLQTATATQDPDTGEVLTDWTIGAVQLPAQWLPASTREAYQAQQRLAAYIDGVFRIDYRARPQPDTQRILWEGRTYDIKPPIELGRREAWDIPVVARAEGP